MSSPVTPTPSPVVRGTTDTATTYFLSSGTRRQIPDAPTLQLLLVGQAVRVVSDADLAALPLGTPMPSRKDGQLLTQKFPAPPPSVVAYYMAAGQRRRIVDIATQVLLVNAGSQIVAIELADLSAIPEGAPLPTRADGTLYQGDAKAYAYLLQGGKKLAFPNATTTRDLGYILTALLPITGGDLGYIPDGTAFTNTSKFLNAPDAQVPLVLLPVRLETRFQNNGTELWLRVYPDDIHVNTFDPALSVDEQTARKSFLAVSATDGDGRKAAFAALAAQFGPQRAAWIASAGPAANNPTASASIARYLPERWIVMGYQGNAAAGGSPLVVGPAISPTLSVDPTAAGASAGISPDTKWITDFNTAVQAGMAFRITLTAAQQRGFTRIVVLGLRSTDNPAAAATGLAQLLNAHHYTDGLELLPVNTLTNNTDSSSSGLSTKDPDYSDLFALEQGPALCPSRPTADGDRLAKALGIDPATFAHVRGANGSQDEQAQAANAVMWPATWGYYLTQLAAAAVTNSATMVSAAQDHFISYVRARGHFPSLRVGRQPYGVLPVFSSDSWSPLEGRALDIPLWEVLLQLRTAWANAAPHVPRIAGSSDPDASLVDVLSMTPSMSSSVARGVVGPEYIFAYWSFIGTDLPPVWWTTLAQSTQTSNTNLAAAMAKTRLASSTYMKENQPLSDVLVAPPPLDGAPAPAFIADLSGKGWQAIRDTPFPATPTPILFPLLQYAALRAYMDTALPLLTTANAAQPSEGVEAEMVNFAGAVLRPAAWDLLARALPGRGAVGTVLDGSKTDATLPEFAAFWSAFNQLATFSASDLNLVIREALDLATYRLDAWITSLARIRLDENRIANASGGIILGAYGWLENVVPQTQPASLGYVHAPSLKQSTTAALLRSGYLTHQGGQQKPFEIDLSSARIRLALHLLDGVREGQELSALLGYRLERTLHDSSLDVLIAKVRAVFPMQDANQLDVADGLALTRSFQSTPTAFWAAMAAQGVTQISAQAPGLIAAVNNLVNALDSVADLTLAEGVHQLANGNLIRAGAVLDSIARGDTPPPDIDFVTTPRSGSALTFRLMTAAIGNNAPGWTVTPRAQAEPRLNAWAAALLGNPSLIRIRAQFIPATGAATNVEIGLNQLALAPIDLLSLPETDGITGEVADRVLRVVASTRPASVPATATVQIVPDRDPDWSAQTIGLAEWLELLRAVTRFTAGVRALEPADLVAPDATPGAIDTAELQARADAAESALRATLTSLGPPASATSDTVLMSAAAFGITGCVPNIDSSQWPSQMASALSQITTRAQALDQLAAGFVRSLATPDAARDHDVARIQAAFGSSFLVLPALSPTLASTWQQLWQNSTPLQGGNPLAANQWMQRASRVRDGVNRFDTAMMYAEALSGTPLLQLQISQSPYAATDLWAALPAPGATPFSRLSLAVFSATPFAAGAPIAGLMVDEWIEVWPATTQTTGVTFQYSDPVARAPQAILLAVQPDAFSEWTLASLEGSVLEALDLAKLRAVDPDIALGTIAPRQIDTAVKSFYALSNAEAFVVTTDGNLWHEQGPFGNVPPTRDHVDSNVSAFQVISSTEVLVLDTSNELWLEHGPFGASAPVKQRVDVGQPTLPVPPTPPPAPTTTSVPDLSGATPAQASSLLKARGLVGTFVGVLQPPVQVSSQNPAAGQTVPIGSVVTVHWIKGPVNNR